MARVCCVGRRGRNVAVGRGRAESGRRWHGRHYWIGKKIGLMSVARDLVNVDLRPSVLLLLLLLLLTMKTTLYSAVHDDASR